MASLTWKTAVVIMPPKECWEPIQAIRHEYDRQVRRWMPHINLLYPFYPAEHFSQVEPKLLMVCGDYQPFELTLSRFRYFEHGSKNHTMWLEPEPGDVVVRLQEKLQNKIPECEHVSRHKGGFTPHLSVGQVRRREELEELLADLQVNWVPLKFLIETVHLIRRYNSPGDIFRVEQSIPFGGS